MNSNIAICKVNLHIPEYYPHNLPLLQQPNLINLDRTNSRNSSNENKPIGQINSNIRGFIIDLIEVHSQWLAT